MFQISLIRLFIHMNIFCGTSRGQWIHFWNRFRLIIYFVLALLFSMLTLLHCLLMFNFLISFLLCPCTTVEYNCAVRSFTWSIILKLADEWDAFDRAIGEVIVRYVPTTVLHNRSGDKQWFDASCWRSYDAKQTLIMLCVKHAMLNIWVNLFLLMLRPRGSMVLQGVSH